MSQFVFVKLQPLEIRLPKESLITQPSLPFALLNNHMKHRYSTSTIHLLRGDQTSIKGHVSFEEREREVRLKLYHNHLTGYRLRL